MTAWKVSISATGRIRSTDLEEPKPLKEQAFATPDKVAEMVSKVRRDLMRLTLLLYLMKSGSI